MEGNQQQQQQSSSSAGATTTTTGYPQQQQQQTAGVYNHLLQQQQQQLQMFWSYQRQDIETANDFKNHSLPLARIKKIMKADEDVRMISAEAPILFAKACELFILELTIRSWLHAEENKRRTLQKNDIAAAITRTDIFDFLVDIVPRDEIKDDGSVGVGVGVGMGMGMGMGMVVGPTAGMPVTVGPTSGMPVPVGPTAGVPVGPTASGVPYYYPPMGQPAPPGVMIGRPAVDPTATAGTMYGAGPPSSAWQSVWHPDDGSYGTGGGGGGNHVQGNLDTQRFSEDLKY